MCWNEVEGARRLMAAVETVTAEGTVRTPDLGGRNRTEEVAVAIMSAPG